jgi:hypothetical protein
VTFTYQLEAADCIAFNLHYMKNSRVYRRDRFRAGLGGLVAFLVFGLALFFARGWDLELAIAFSVIGVVMFFAFPKVYDDSNLKSLKRTLNDPDNAKAFARQTVTLAPEGFYTSRPGAEATTAWDNILKLAETPDHLFLYLSAAYAIIIPRRSLEGASFEDVRDQIRRYHEAALVSASDAR